MAKRIMTLTEARKRYKSRFTMEHVPKWAKEKREDGGYYAPQYATDREWYDNTMFPGEGGISTMSILFDSRNKTWPLGVKLGEPYTIDRQRKR
jgi:hypothetical protein